MIEQSFPHMCERKRTFTFKWNGHHCQDQLMEGVMKISQNETTEFFNDFIFVLLQDYKNYLKKAVISLDFSALTVKLIKALLLIACDGLDRE